MSVVKQIASVTGVRVLSGPFRGMHYVPHAVCGRLGPRILGTYEMELRSILGEILALNPRLVLDIGAAEGYYAVGLARRIPGATIVAFEANEQAQHLLRDMALRNGVSDQVVVRGICTPDALKDICKSELVDCVIMDVEGDEVTLLGPDSPSWLRNTRIVVEIHDHLRPHAGDLIYERFRRTHTIQEIKSQYRKCRDVTNLALRGAVLICNIAGRNYLDEGRKCIMRWFYMTPRRH